MLRSSHRGGPGRRGRPPCSNTNRHQGVARAGWRRHLDASRSRQRHRVERHRQRGVLVEHRAGFDAARAIARRVSARAYRAYIAPSANSRPETGRPELRVLEHLAHRDTRRRCRCALAISAVICVDSYGSSSSSFGFRKCCSLRIGCSLRNVSKIARLVREVEVAVLGEQALEHELTIVQPSVVPFTPVRAVPHPRTRRAAVPPGRPRSGLGDL